jgi:hypothetical protein
MKVYSEQGGIEAAIPALPKLVLVVTSGMALGKDTSDYLRFDQYDSPQATESRQLSKSWMSPVSNLDILLVQV